MHKPSPLAVPDSAGLVPVVVAVSGHRHFPAEDIPRIEQSVIAAMMDLQSRCPHSPVWLLSGLAEGADRIAARCALELGWQVHAVIPQSLQAYESSMSSTEALDEFRMLLSRCESIRILPVSSADQMYLDIAAYLCQQGQWLIAVWDGKPSQGPGGTGDVVRLFERGVVVEVGTLPDTGPVIHIQARRSVDELPAEDVGRLRYRWPKPLNLDEGSTGPDQWHRVLARIDDFNLLAADCLATEFEALEQHRRDLVGSQPDEGSPGADAVRVSWIYAVADRLSLKFQARRMRTFFWMLCWSLLAIVAEQLYSGPLNNLHALVATIICAALAVFPELARRLSRFWGRGGEEAAYLDCRALAEACRVQYFWRLNAIPDASADVFLSEQRDELEWIRQALRSADVGESIPVSVSAKQCQFTLTHWIAEQRRFFIGDAEHNSRSARNFRKAHQFDRIVTLLFSLVLLLLSLAVILHMLSMTQWLSSVQMGWGVALGAAATVKLYQRTLAHHENARRYARMGLATKVAEITLGEELSSEPDLHKCQKILRSYGHAALRENEHWLMLLRSRPAGASIGN